MTSSPIILAIDHGTSSMKAALIQVDGQVLGWESRPMNLYLTPDGGAEQSPDEWWDVLLTICRQLLQRFPEAGQRVRAICASTQGEGTIPVDADGRALMNCVLWMDMRGAENLKSQFRGLININGVSLYKTLRWVNRTGGLPSLTGKDPAAHMLFIRDHYPDIYERTYKFLNVLDYLNLKLTGRFTATFDSILTSWVTDNRKPDDIQYDFDLVRDSGIEADKFPEIVPSTAVLGNLKTDVASALGLSGDVKVVAGAIDNTAAAIGAGTIADYATHLYIGTSAWMAAHVPFKKTDVATSMASVPCALPGHYLLTALQATAGGNLTFLRDNILYYKDELLQEENVPDIFKVLDIIAARVPAGSHGLVYTPWIWGERAPIDDKAVRAGLYNLSLHNTREDIIRAMLEGVAFNARWLLDPVEKFMKRRVYEIHIVGGGAQSDIWCQIFADVMNVEIKQAAEPVYANARGAAWIGAVGLGEITFNDVPGLVRFKNTYRPDPRNRGLYDDSFNTFKQIYRQMKGIYHHLNR